MGAPLLLQNEFSGGMHRDHARNELPRGTVWSIVDYIPDLGAPLRKRGGWSYHGTALTAIRAAATGAFRVLYYENIDRVLVVDDGDYLLDLSAGSNLVFGTSTPVHQMFEAQGIVILTCRDGVTAPKTYNGTTLSSLGGSPPAGRIGCGDWKLRAILGNSSALPRRIWFSGDANPAVWDTTNGYLDFLSTPLAIQPIADVLLVFTDESVLRIRGSIPPPGRDLTVDRLFDQGANMGMVAGGKFVYFANGNGVFYTDGIDIGDLTREGGISRYWREKTPVANSFAKCQMGYWSNYLFCVIDDEGVVADVLVCHIPTKSWFRMANVNTTAGVSYSLLLIPLNSFAATDFDLFFTVSGQPQVGKMSSIISPGVIAAPVKNDANGTAVAPILETGFYGLGKPGRKTWKHVYLGYDIRDQATDDPTLTLSYITSPEATAYTTISSTLGETLKYTRKRRPLRVGADGMAFRVAQTGPSSDTRIYGLEAEAHARETSRV